MASVRRMRKTDLMMHFIEHFSSLGLTLRRSDAREFFDELHRVCVRQLKDTGEFTLPRIAKFLLRQRAARTGRNPRTGESVRIRAGLAVTVRVARQLKDAFPVDGFSNGK